MEFAEWPGVVDVAEGLFNQPVPAKTATMWYAELRHYEANRIEGALRRVARAHMSPFLPPLGIVLASVRADGGGTPLTLVSSLLGARSDQFQLPKGESDEEAADDSVFARGLVCATAGCGYTPVRRATAACPLCGGGFMPDGHMLATGQANAAA